MICSFAFNLSTSCHFLINIAQEPKENTVRYIGAIYAGYNKWNYSIRTLFLLYHFLFLLENITKYVIQVILLSYGRSLWLNFCSCINCKPVINSSYTIRNAFCRLLPSVACLVGVSSQFTRLGAPTQRHSCGQTTLLMQKVKGR